MTIIYPIPEKLPDPRARFIQIINTCHALAEKDVEVKLISGIKNGYSERRILQFYGLTGHPNLKILKLPMLRKEDARYIRFSWHGIFHFFLLVYLLFIKFFKKEDPILFLRHLKLADFVLKFKGLLNIPVVFEVHEIFHLNTINKKKKGDLKQQEIMVYKNADAVVCLSISLKQYLVDNMGVSEKSVFIIPDAVKKEWFDIKKTAGEFICYTGSLYNWKGVDTLISATKYLPGERLLIVGGGERLEGLRRLAAAEGVADRVDFTGAVPHSSIPEYLSMAKVLVLPNIAEGPSEFSSPLKLFEYMASGVPIVASDIQSFKEILTHKRNALMFEPGSPEALASAIKEIIKDRNFAEGIAKSAKRDAEDYTYEKRGERIIKAVKALDVNR
jgi:glycosyltransferase involved in cell wall biosynthesis